MNQGRISQSITIAEKLKIAAQIENRHGMLFIVENALKYDVANVLGINDNGAENKSAIAKNATPFVSCPK